MTTAVILVPWRDKGDCWRTANLSAVLAHLSTMADLDVDVVDDAASGPFNRSRAYNRGIARHPSADVFLFHEADMLVPEAQLRQAIAWAVGRTGLIVPFDLYRYLSTETTERVRAGRDPLLATPEYVMSDGRSNGAVNVVSAATMRAVGCWDEEFAGWGFDDRAMVRAFEVATGHRQRR